MNHFSFFSLEPTGYTQTVTYIIHGQICTGLFLCALLCSGTWALGRCCFVEVIKLIEIQLLLVVCNYAGKLMFLHFNCVMKIRLIRSCFVSHVWQNHSFICRLLNAEQRDYPLPSFHNMAY